MADTFSDTPNPDTPSRRPQDRAAEVATGRAGRSTGKSLIGKPVITLADGKQVGETHDVVYSAAAGRLIGFTLLQNAGLFKRGNTYWLPAESIHSIGEDAITIQASSLLTPVNGDVNDYAAEAGHGVLGKRLMTEEGKFLGSIDDVLVERASMKVVAYAISGGLIQDLYQGQTDGPVDTVISIGQDVVVVPSSLQALVEAPKGGLVAATAAAQVKAGELSQEASTGIATARTQAAEAIEQKEADYAVGKQAGRDVADDAGAPLIMTGQIITPAIIKQAIAAGRMHALAASAGYDQAGEAVAATKEKAGSLTDAARARLGQSETPAANGHAAAYHEPQTETAAPVTVIVEPGGRAEIDSTGAVVQTSPDDLQKS